MLLFRSRAIITYALALSLTLFYSASLAHAQSDDGEADPIKLFERGQSAHARGELELAVNLYAQALELRPEFPEAEYQRAIALLSLDRLPEAEQGLKRAIELRSDWAMPVASLGALLVRLNRLDEADKQLNRALELDAKNSSALVALADLRLRNRAGREPLTSLLTRLRDATTDAEAKASVWAARGAVERALSQKEDAMASLDRALAIDPRDVAARSERAQLFASNGDYARAIEDAKETQRLNGKSATLLLAIVYAHADRKDEALRTLDALDEATKRLPEAVSLRNALLMNGEADVPTTRDAIEKALEREPRNAALLARLGALYRTEAPARAVEYYRRALEIEPRNADYATGYGAALVQARRLPEAVQILRQVTSVAPGNYVAHANLAIALYESKRFKEALTEYEWLVAAKPDIAATYFFIATSHDNLGEYAEALAAYESFLARADAQKNSEEIERVNLRLPSLRQQVKRGEGKKKDRKS